MGVRDVTLIYLVVLFAFAGNKLNQESTLKRRQKGQKKEEISHPTIGTSRVGNSHWIVAGATS